MIMRAETKAKSIVMGACPKCGSENIEYGDTNISGDCLGYEFECQDCGCQATEWYDLTYVETVED